MCLYVEIETTQPITSQRICSTLQHDAARLISCYHWFNNRFEKPNVGIIVYPILQWHIQSIMLARATTHIIPVSSSREEIILVVLMKRKRHDSIGRKERLLHPITMVHVDIDIENSRVDTQ